MSAMPWVKVLKHNKTFLTYLSALLIALIVFYVLPAYPGMSLDSERPPFALLELAIEGELEEADWPIINQDWDFNSPDTRLMITSSSRDYLETTIVVAETAPEGSISVKEYVSNSFIADRISAHQVSLSGKELMINFPAEQRIQLYYFSSDILSQFDSERSSWHQEAGRVISPRVLLYIQVPAGLEVMAAEGITLVFLSDYH